MTSPLFTIVTVVRNDVTGFAATRESVRQQSCQDFEWRIVDGASNDGTADAARSCADARTFVVSEPDLGIFDAMNKGLAGAQGRYIVFMNAGDTLAHREVLKAVATRLAASQPDLLYGDSLERYGGERLLRKAARGHERAHEGMFACHQSMYFRRGALNGLLFDQRFKVSGDYHFAASFLKQAEGIEYLAQALCIFDLHGVSNASRRRGRHENWCVQRDVLAVPLARRIGLQCRYLVSSLLATRFQGVYKRVRYGEPA